MTRTVARRRSFLAYSLIALALVAFAALRARDGYRSVAYASAAQDAAPRSGESKPLLVLVSFDGWRWDYADRHRTPNLRALAGRGVRAERLIPSFPVLTFPNHYTIVTGLYPEHHGIVANRMGDPVSGRRFTMAAPTAKDAEWWGGEPLWVTAMRQGRRTASMFWPGAEAPIAGMRPSLWRPFDKALSSTARVDQIVEWLALPESERPAVTTLYFDEVDSAGHDYGVDSPQLDAAVEHVDAALGRLASAIVRLGLESRTTLVVVSDHGMTSTSRDRVILLDDYVDTSTVDVFETGGLLTLAPKDGNVSQLFERLHGRHPALDVYRREDTPPRLHYRDNPRIAPIIGIPHHGWVATTRANLAQKPLEPGAHGYEPDDPDMGALFVAAGPEIAHGLVVPPFPNVDVYDFLCDVLHLPPAKNDGHADLSGRLMSAR